MDSKMEQIIELIITSLEAQAKITKIDDVIYNHRRYHNVSCTKNYNNYNVEEFLNLFKIDYLEKIGIIDIETSKSLKDLYLLKIDLERKIGELSYLDLSNENKNHDKEINDNCKKVEMIDNVLKKYHLLVDYDEYERMFYSMIENDKYHDIEGNEEVKKMIKKIKL